MRLFSGCNEHIPFFFSHSKKRILFRSEKKKQRANSRSFSRNNQIDSFLLFHVSGGVQLFHIKQTFTRIGIK